MVSIIPYFHPQTSGNDPIWIFFRWVGFNHHLHLTTQACPEFFLFPHLICLMVDLLVFEVLKISFLNFLWALVWVLYSYPSIDQVQEDFLCVEYQTHLDLQARFFRRKRPLVESMMNKYFSDRLERRNMSSCESHSWEKDPFDKMVAKVLHRLRRRLIRLASIQHAEPICRLTGQGLGLTALQVGGAVAPDWSFGVGWRKRSVWSAL